MRGYFFKPLKGCIPIFDTVVKRNHVAFRTIPKYIEQSLEKGCLSFLSSCDDCLALRDLSYQMLVPIAQEAVELFFPSDEEVSLADLFRLGTGFRIRHRQHRFHPLCVCIPD